jgi:hypothetical protein
MDPPLFHLAPSGDVPLLTLRISRSLFPNMAIAPEMAAAGLVCPFRVKSVSESKKKCDGLWRHLRTMPSGLGYVYSGGRRRACSLKRGYRNRPVRFAEAGPSIYGGTLDRGL